MGLFTKEPEVLPFNTNTATTDEKLERANVLMRELNDIWASMPRNYKMWIDWDARPRRLIMTDYHSVEKHVILPR